MSKLNRDILYLVFEEFQDDIKALYSSLSVNKTWCEIIVLILWKNPWKYLTNKNENLLFNVIISHLSDESKNNLINHNIELFTIFSQKPLFNYISFCKHLNLSSIDKIINTIKYYCTESSMSILKNEIYNLFINENTKFTYLYIPQHFDYQIHLIPGAKHCFSEIIFLSCNIGVNDNVLIGLAGICQSIKELELFVESKNSKNSYGITKLIDASKKLIDVRLLTANTGLVNVPIINNIYYVEESLKPFHIILENSLMKHAHTIQYFMITAPPATRILSSLVNLKKLELRIDNHNVKLDFLENVSLSSLRILKSNIFQIKFLRNLILNTDRSLTKISIDNKLHNEIDNKNIIKAIYQNCPNLIYLKLMFRNENILELEQLLINCQYLIGLYFLIINIFNWDKLFEILNISSPTSLFKFKFNIISHESINLESLILFINNWKGRHPMLLQLDSYGCTDLFDLIEEYKSEGIIKKFNYLHRDFEDFEW
ncbi:hypothetical protein RhiirA1_464667 [Rhizophagus irregularis]|uniref:Uncharacterized protein n=2 Tax=Rhizophagus irregularis TaxID=588596 RepID=A0A2I1EUE4_9GLOM|nr:hypothetical protein GLOIN_2v1877952 [Rhizophagus irregularis DAOM 181602=DAOM 197198]PKC62796.1 hypothetical protein RhiirA1_464667 [Rhizophagus irregularis]PKY25725.1 hypothetical protein RhiirB3_440789 [Rhizophagus irregularis]POG68986.1 hypothetical protein GLOIN_2v1877952 [Rhizophagus irregularis DAOM 181602=DAOM 197198]UZO23610.1 hypothetical protein OCT59_015942 [Rhizophagus irregularis]CAG8594678.1 8563_t:CDS:1 [Rhizophagus irregularis]|eukprot:XP_025175852.1 hypothetical protein GLOIN_2v1877952 [Rhizophagus irregularis DAOM 181602=DAOM 197198]